jgi:hypothetical protein
VNDIANRNAEDQKAANKKLIDSIRNNNTHIFKALTARRLAYDKTNKQISDSFATSQREMLKELRKNVTATEKEIKRLEDARDRSADATNDAYNTIAHLNFDERLDTLSPGQRVAALRQLMNIQVQAAKQRASSGQFEKAEDLVKEAVDAYKRLRKEEKEFLGIRVANRQEQIKLLNDIADVDIETQKFVSSELQKQNALLIQRKVMLLDLERDYKKIGSSEEVVERIRKTKTQDELDSVMKEVTAALTSVERVFVQGGLPQYAQNLRDARTRILEEKKDQEDLLKQKLKDDALRQKQFKLDAEADAQREAVTSATGAMSEFSTAVKDVTVDLKETIASFTGIMKLRRTDFGDTGTDLDPKKRGTRITVTEQARVITERINRIQAFAARALKVGASVDELKEQRENLSLLRLVADKFGDTDLIISIDKLANLLTGYTAASKRFLEASKIVAEEKLYNRGGKAFSPRDFKVDPLNKRTYKAPSVQTPETEGAEPGDKTAAKISIYIDGSKSPEATGQAVAQALTRQNRRGTFKIA